MEMEDFLKRLKEDLEEFSPEKVTITVIRKDLERLIKTYEELKEKGTEG